jgi:hypothetical protein
MDLITNYFENLVYETIRRKLAGTAAAHDDDYIADVACVALNKLPARYVRHIVDTRFFESEEEYRVDAVSVERAVVYALDFIDQRTGISPDGSAHFRPDNGSYDSK